MEYVPSALPLLPRPSSMSGWRRTPAGAAPAPSPLYSGERARGEGREVRMKDEGGRMKSGRPVSLHPSSFRLHSYLPRVRADRPTLFLAVAAHGISAAERRKNVAPGASPGNARRRTTSPGGAEEASYAPPGLVMAHRIYPSARALGYILTPLRGCGKSVGRSASTGERGPEQRTF
jgi:hypothetical protein